MRWDEVSYRFLEDRLRVPVIEGVAAAIKLAEAMVAMAFRPRKREASPILCPKLTRAISLATLLRTQARSVRKALGTICSSDRREHQVLA